MRVKKILKPSIALLAALAAASAILTSGAGTDGRSEGVVTAVFDGDTLLVLTGGREEKVRLLGIDAPETDGPYTSLEPLGEEAKERAAELALGRKVGLAHGGTTLRDKYGRLLAYVHLPNGRVLNEALLEEGLARAYRRFDHPRKSFYVYLEWKAWVNRKGIWEPKAKGHGPAQVTP